MEPASELRTIEVRRFSCVIGRRASNVQAFGHSANQGGTAEAFRSLVRDAGLLFFVFYNMTYFAGL